jgi:hypothetical protein
VPRALGLFPSALVAARADMSANAYYRELRSLGIAARRSEVLALFKIAKSITAASPHEPFRDITQVPQGHEVEPWPAKKATGLVQNVTLIYRDKVTGNGIPREQAVATAIDAYTGTTSGEGQDFIYAVHTSAYRLTPGLV